MTHMLMKPTHKVIKNDGGAFTKSAEIREAGIGMCQTQKTHSNQRHVDALQTWNANNQRISSFINNYKLIV